jgi:hypothetical protein
MCIKFYFIPKYMGLSSALGITGILFVVIGIIMAIVGIILLIVNQDQMKPWYIWFLLVGGVIIGILGGIMLAIALADTRTYPAQVMMAPVAPNYVYAQPPPQPVMQAAPAPLYLKAKEQPPVEVRESRVPIGSKYNPYAQTQETVEVSTQRGVPANVDFGNRVESHVGDYTTVNKRIITQDPGEFAVEERPRSAPAPVMPYYTTQQQLGTQALNQQRFSAQYA